MPRRALAMLLTSSGEDELVHHDDVTSHQRLVRLHAAMAAAYCHLARAQELEQQARVLLQEAHPISVASGHQPIR